jgi:hypothetical protein
MHFKVFTMIALYAILSVTTLKNKFNVLKLYIIRTVHTVSPSA